MSYTTESANNPRDQGSLYGVIPANKSEGNDRTGISTFSNPQ